MKEITTINEKILYYNKLVRQEKKKALSLKSIVKIHTLEQNIKTLHGLRKELVEFYHKYRNPNGSISILDIDNQEAKKLLELYNDIMILIGNSETHPNTPW